MSVSRSPVFVNGEIVFVLDGDDDVVAFPVLIDDGVAERQQQDEQQQKDLGKTNAGIQSENINVTIVENSLFSPGRCCRTVLPVRPSRPHRPWFVITSSSLPVRTFAPYHYWRRRSAAAAAAGNRTCSPVSGRPNQQRRFPVTRLLGDNLLLFRAVVFLAISIGLSFGRVTETRFRGGIVFRR